MSETAAATAEHAVNPDVNHETSDVNVRAIIGFGVSLAVLIGVVHLLMLLLFDGLAEEDRQLHKPLPPLARKERAVFPKDLDRIPGPRLQVSEEGDLEKMR